MPAPAAPAIMAAGDRRRTAFSLTRSGPEGSSRNEFQAGSSAGLLPPTGRAARRALWAEGRRCTDERGRRRLSRARAQVPAGELRRPDRPGPPRPHAEQRDRDGSPGSRLSADGRARGGQDLDRADHRARAQLHRRGRNRRPHARPLRYVRPLRLDRRGPPRRRHRDGRGLAHRHRRRARADRERALSPRSRRATRSTSSTKCTCSRSRPSTRCSRRWKSRRPTSNSCSRRPRCGACR